MAYEFSRRNVVLLAAGAVFAFGVNHRNARTRQPSVSFWVAGVRFQTGTATPEKGDSVMLVRQQFGDQLSYSVETKDGERLGFVPKEMVPILVNLGQTNAFLMVADYQALPWKRFQVRT